MRQQDAWISERELSQQQRLKSALRKLVLDLSTMNCQPTVSRDEVIPIHQALREIIPHVQPLHGEWLTAQIASFSKMKPSDWALSCEERLKLIQHSHLCH
jgi:hypothetical protein